MNDALQGLPVYISSKAELNSTFRALHEAASELLEHGGAEVRLKALDARTAEQNKLLWSALGDVSQQVTWYGKKLSKDAWKDIFSAAIRKQEVVPGLDGNFVVVGGRTSKMSKRMFADLVTVIHAFGADPEHIVHWSDPKWKAYEIQPT